MVNVNKAKQKDHEDRLAPFREEFHHVPDEIYLDGNSLGKLPLKTTSILTNVIEQQWGQNLIRSWNDHWLDLPKRLSNKLAKLLHADPSEITVGESTSVNLYKVVLGLLHAGLFPRQLLTDSLNFPTDNYILEGITKQHQLPQPVCVQYSSDLTADLEKLKKMIKQHPSIVCLSLVSYKSAYLYPMKILNTWAKKQQSIIVWDLSHAVGAVDIDLRETECLAAIGCTYKYLNGGPGAPAFLYVNKSLHSHVNSPIQGWFGHARPFDFSSDYSAADNISKFDAGTPTILSLAGIESGIDLTLKAGIKHIRTKSEALTSFFIERFKEELLPLSYALETPADGDMRGSHVTLSHEESWRICQCLLQGKKDRPKVIPDFRPHRYLRFGFAPLYTTFQELDRTIDRLREIVLDKEYEHFGQSRPQVT